MKLPRIVSAGEWQAAHEKLLAKEKEATRARDAGDKIYRTYFTTSRGVEALGPAWTFFDLTPLGRQEEWEDSPEGYPQTPPYQWWRRHDEYRAGD
jgi:predicted dithiol-disulfide oxidoreductase (DUF899 family)